MTKTEVYKDGVLKTTQQKNKQNLYEKRISEIKGLKWVDDYEKELEKFMEPTSHKKIEDMDEEEWEFYKETGIPPVSDDHPIYKEPPFIIFSNKKPKK